MHTFLLVSFKPLIVMVFGLIVMAITWILDKLIPEGRVKRFLFKQRGSSARRAEQPAELTSEPQLTPEAARLVLRAFRRE